MQVKHANNPATQPQTFRATPADKAQTEAGPDLRPAGRRQQRALHRQLLAPAADRLQRGQRARRRAGHRPRRLADHLRGAGAVLHEGRVGAWRLRRAGTVRSAALAAVSDAAAAGEVLRRAAGARRAGAGPASAADADGDQLAALQRPAACQHCGFCLFFMCEFRREVDVDGRRCCRWRRPRARCEIRPEQLRGAGRDRTGRARDAASSISTRRSSCSGSGPKRSCSARTAPRRRGCC